MLDLWNGGVQCFNDFFEYCSKFSRLALYGAGDVGRMVAEYMEEEKIPFSYYCVTGKPEKAFLGNHEIKGIDDIFCSDDDIGIIVSVSKKNANAILRLLCLHRISYFYDSEFLFQLFCRKCQKSVAKVFVREGYLEQIFDIVFQKDVMYLCCPASIGDTLYTAALVKAYKQENPEIKKVCLVLKKGHKELGNLFPSVDEVLVSDEIVEVLDHYSLFKQIWKGKNYLYGHFKKSLRFEYEQGYFQEDCKKILPRYQKLIMNLHEPAELEKINLPQKSLAIMEQRHCIVLMPYARTAPLLPPSFWEILVRQLKQKEYVVYTNLGSEKEKPIQGSEPMAESLLDTVLFCENCTAVIALRSGLCDLLGFTKTKLIVINTSQELFSEWNLEDVFHREGIFNICCFGSEYNDRQNDEQVDEIIRIVG